MEYINEIENIIGKKAIKNYLPIQAGDIPQTSADINLLESYVNYKPKTSIKFGIKQFIEWYLYYKVKLRIII